MKKYADPPALQSHWILTRPIDGRLSLCVGYQLAQMLAGKGMDTTYDHPAASALGVKWVNDIGWYIGSDFCKMAGILLEPVTVKGEMLGVVMGVGINVTNAPILPNLAESNYRAVALVDVLLAHQVPLLADLAQMVDVAIFRALRQFNGLCNTQAAQDFCQQFAAVDLLLGKRVRVLSTQGNAPMIGIAHGIDAAGCLQLCLSDNVNPATITRIWNGRVRVL